MLIDGERKELTIGSCRLGGDGDGVALRRRCGKTWLMMRVGLVVDFF